MRRGEPQIDVTFNVDANGIRQTNPIPNPNPNPNPSHGIRQSQGQG